MVNVTKVILLRVATLLKYAFFAAYFIIPTNNIRSARRSILVSYVFNTPQINIFVS